MNDTITIVHSSEMNSRGWISFEKEDRLEEVEERSIWQISLHIHFTGSHLLQMVQNDGQLFTTTSRNSENWKQPV